MYFHYFVIIFLWKRAGPFIWTNLNLLHPRVFYAKIGWNWPSGIGEDNFKISSMYFHHFVIISPWKRTGPFISSYESPSLKDVLYQVWLKFAQWFWRRKILNFVNVFSLFSNYLPLEKGRALHLNKLEYPSSK